VWITALAALACWSGPAAADPPLVARSHVVASGDTLGSIAIRYHVSVAALVSANRLAGDKARLRIGQTLVVPPAPAVAKTPAAPVVKTPPQGKTPPAGKTAPESKTPPSAGKTTAESKSTTTGSKSASSAARTTAKDKATGPAGKSTRSGASDSAAVSSESSGSVPERRASAVAVRGSVSRAAIPARGPRGLELTVPDFVDAAPPFAWPVEGPITSTFGRRRSAWHRGIDIKADRGAVVFAAAAGTVVTSDVEPRYGRVVKIEHEDGFVTVYAHNQENLVEPGMKVAAGDPVAIVGRTGRATSEHLHFEIRRNGAVYNPLYLLPLPPRVGQVEETDEPTEEHE